MAPQGYHNVSLTTDGKLALTRIAARVRTCIGEDGDALNLSEAVRVVERLLAAHRDTDPIKLREDLRDAASRAGVRITAGEGVSDPLPVTERRIVRCEARARQGTGVGTCNRTLDQHGNCYRAADHIEVVS